MPSPPPRHSLAAADIDLVVRVARENRDAFAELFRRYGPTAYGVAHRITRDPQHAEAVVQEAFLAVWRQASRFDARRGRPATWLLAIVHHKAVDAVRGEQLRRTESAETLAELADDSVDLPQEACLSEQRDHVLRALAELTDQQREVIELAYFQGHSQSQIAFLLEKPLGTIKSRTSAALARLRVELEDPARQTV